MVYMHSERGGEGVIWERTVGDGPGINHTHPCTHPARTRTALTIFPNSKRRTIGIKKRLGL